MKVRIYFEHSVGWQEARSPNAQEFEVSWLKWTIHKIAARLDTWAYRRIDWPKT